MILLKLKYVLVVIIELTLFITISVFLLSLSYFFSGYFPFNKNLLIYTDEKIDPIEIEKIKKYYYSQGVNYVDVELLDDFKLKISYNSKKNEYILPPLKTVKELTSYPSLFLKTNSFFSLSLFHFLLLIWGLIKFIKLSDGELPKSFTYYMKGLAILFPTLAFNYIYDLILKYLLKYNFDWVSLLLSGSSNIFLSFLFIVILAPISEEIYFRGYVFNLFKQKIDLKFAFFISSILFALIHYNLPYFIGIFFIGYLLALSYKVSNSISVPILIHIIINFLYFSFAFF